MPKPIDKLAKPYLERIENINEQIASLTGEFMSECKTHKEDIREIYAEAKNAGVAVKALKGLVKWRALERKQEEIGAGLDIDEGAAYEVLVEQLGPLGIAAAKRAGHGGDDDDKDLRGDAQKRAEQERKDEDALKGVGRGKNGTPATH